MTTETLKPRAKRLRAAVAKMFNVVVTHSQSLELVAKEENYPNWDAACASYRRSQPSAARVPVVNSLKVAIIGDQKPSVASIFGREGAVSLELSRLLGMSDSRGSLVLIAGTTGQGKTTTANSMMDELASGFDSPHEGGKLSRRLKLIDEVRNEADAFQAVALAMAGMKVVAIIHAAEGRGLDRLRIYLQRHGAGEQLLDRLIADGQVMVIHQELAWADPAMQQRFLQQRRHEAEAVLRTVLRYDSEIVSCLPKPREGMSVDVGPRYF